MNEWLREALSRADNEWSVAKNDELYNNGAADDE